MSAYRPIQPSTSSNPASDQGNSENPLQPFTDGVSAGKARRRKAPSHVSQNACTNCKKARAKCDGKEPDPCSRCSTRQISESCHYEVHVKTAKEELIKKIKNLESKNKALRGSVEEKDRWIANIVQAFQNEKQAGGLDGLTSTKSPVLQSLLHAIKSPPPPERPRSVSSTDLTRRLSDAGMSGMSDDSVNLPWTATVDDEDTADHLMALFFAWVHPVHMLFSERHFVESFGSGNSLYCSHSMVNAICALGCIYSEDFGNVPRLTMLDNFYKRAKAEVEVEDQSTSTLGITYALLFLIEMCKGEASRAAPHLRLAVELLRTSDRHRWATEAVEISNWGIHTLNTTWAAFTYEKPSDPLPPRAIVFKEVRLDFPTAYWKSYRQPSDARLPEVPSFAIQTAKEFARLNQIIFETMKIFCGRRGRVTARSILELYRSYLLWRQSLSPQLASPLEIHSSRVPHIYFLHIQYCVAVMQLFTPLLIDDSFPALTREHIRNLVANSASEGLALYQSYRNLYTNRYQPPLMSFCLAHLGNAVVRYGERVESPRAAQFCLEAFAEAIPAFKYAAPLAAMFCESLHQHGVTLPADVDKYIGGKPWTSYSRQVRLDCCDRGTFTQPVNMLVERLDPEIADNFESEWRVFIETHGGKAEFGVSSAKIMDVSRIINP